MCDLVLFNKDAVFIFEVNERVHFKDIEQLIHRKGSNFPLLFPQRNLQCQLGLATFSISMPLCAAAFPIIQPQGYLLPKRGRPIFFNECDWFACWIVVFAQLGQLSLKQLLIIPIPLENPDEPGAGRHRIHQAASRRMAY